MTPVDLKTWYDTNSSWIGLVSLLLAVVAIPLSIYLWRRPHRSKMLGCERISGYSLVQVPVAQRDKHPLKLLYGSQEVTSPYISILRVGNLGDEEVLAEDFDIPITIDFSKGRLLAFDVIEKSSSDIEPVFTVDTMQPNRIKLKPLLLNGHEWIDIQCVSDGNPGLPEVHSRIAGQTRSIVELMDRAEKMRRQLVWLAAALAIAVFGLVGISMFTEKPVGDEYMLPLIAFVAGFFFGSIPLLNQMEAKQHRAWAKKKA